MSRNILLFFLIITLATMSVFVPGKVFAQALIPFGGPITFAFPCDEGLWLEIGPPTPYSLMYIPGESISYAFGPPDHIGQFLLGMATGFFVCTESGIPAGGGLVILFHGSSI